MAQQTAINWLLENLQKVHKMDWDIVFIHAELMEKKQIKEAWLSAWKDSMLDPLEDKYYEPEAEAYYIETYGRKSEILITKSENK